MASIIKKIYRKIFPDRVCGNCKFYEGGYCHRYPPQVVVWQDRAVEFCPEVCGHAELCGEHRRKW